MSWLWGVADYFNWSPFKYIPGYQDKGLMDNWSITMGANDRTTLLGPSINFNMGATYSTSYDVAAMLMNTLLNKIPMFPPAGRAIVKGVLGNGDIKLVLGPSTSLLYGGPAGTSKRGPYWERIAGTWWDPRGKGAKYSAEGSFSPGSVGKGAASGLQFFERDQIFGEQSRPGLYLAVMLKAGKRQKITPSLFDDVLEGEHLWDNPVLEKPIKEIKDLDDVKKDKFESDLAKCYTNEELAILEQGDKAAKYGTSLLLLLDLAVNAFAIFLTQWQNTGKTSQGSLVFNKETAQKAYDNAKDTDKQATANDLAWTKTMMMVRLIYKIVKILAMQIIEILENTDRLARIVITNADMCKDIGLADYAQNIYLSAEKRAEICDEIADLALKKISKDKEDRLGWSPKQIKDIVNEAAEIVAGEEKPI
jgi:hypothetical protein